MSLEIRKEITSNISIDALSIPELGIEFEFDHFKINTFEIPEGVIWEDSLEDEEKPIAYESWSLGEEANEIYHNAFLKRMGKCVVSGEAQNYISKFSICSMWDECEIVNGENYEKYRNLPNIDESIYVYSQQKESNYTLGEEISLRYNYVYNAESIENYDYIMSTVLMQIETLTGEKIWKAGYVGLGEVGAYLILPMV